jgi:DNA-binding SARP family transcriptional activator/DNA-binding XRE family transcriptional regulator
MGWPSGAGVLDTHQAGGGEVCGGDRTRAARLAALVRDYRRAARLTQGQLASLSGVSLAAIRDLEQGRRHRPRAGSLARLTTALGLDAAQAGELAALTREGSRTAAGTGEAAGQPGTAGGLRLQVLGPLAAWRDGVRLPLGGPRQQAVLGLLALAPGSLVHRSAIVDMLWPGDPPATAVSAVQSHISRLRGLLNHPPPHDGREPADHELMPRNGGPVDGWQPRDGGLLDHQRAPGDGVGRLVSAGASYSLRAGPGELDLLDFGRLAEDARAARQAGDAAGACGLYERALGLWRGEPLAGVDLLAAHPGRAALAAQHTETVIEYAQLASTAGWHERALAALRALAAAEPLNERAHAQLMIALAGCGQQAEALRLFADLRARLDAELAMPPGPELAEAHLRVLRQDIPPPTHGGMPRQGAGIANPAVGGGAPPVPRQLPAGVRHFVGRAEEIGKLSALAEEAVLTAGTVVISAIGGTAGVGKTALALHWAHQVADRFPDGQLYVNLRGFGPSGTPATPGEAIRGFLDALGAPPERIPAALDSQAALYRSLLAGKRMLIILDNARDAEQVRPLLPGGPTCLVLVTSRRQLSGLVAAEGAHAITLDMLTEADAAALHRMLGHYLHSARAADQQIYPSRRRPIGAEPPAAGTAPEPFADDTQALAWFEAEHQVLLAAIGLAAAEGFDACAWQLAWAMETFFFRRTLLHDWAATQRTGLAAARHLGDRNGQAWAHRGIASALTELGDYRDAHAQLRQAMILRRRLGDRAGQAQLFGDLSHLHQRQGWLRRALRTAQQALSMYRELGDRWGEAIALNYAGWTLGQLGDYRQMLAYCQQALVIMVAANDRQNTANTLDSVGYAYRHLGHHARAAACYRRAVHVYTEFGYRYPRAETLGYAGDAHLAAGDPLAARDAWQEALHILDELHHPDAGQLRAKLRALPTGAPPGPASSPPLPAAGRH